MGIAVSTSVSSVTQRAVNRTYQEARNVCKADCNQIISGNTIVLDNSQAGDVTFTQRCSADANCYMTNAVEQAVNVFQAARAEAGAAPSLFPGIQINTSVAVTDTQVTNEMTQILSNLCEGDVNQEITENIVYATDSTLGNIGFVQEGSALAQCVMENSARMQLKMQQEGDAVASAGGAIAGLGGIIGLIILVIIVIVIVRSLKKGGNDSGGAPPPRNTAPSVDRSSLQNAFNSRSSGGGTRGVTRRR